MRSIPLYDAGNVRVANEFQAAGFREYPHVDVPVAVHHETECSKAGGGIRILRAKPCRAGVLALQDFEHFVACLHDGFSLLPHEAQVVMNKVSGHDASRWRAARWHAGSNRGVTQGG